MSLGDPIDLRPHMHELYAHATMGAEAAACSDRRLSSCKDSGAGGQVDNPAAKPQLDAGMQPADTAGVAAFSARSSKSGMRSGSGSVGAGFAIHSFGGELEGVAFGPQSSAVPATAVPTRPHSGRLQPWHEPNADTDQTGVGHSHDAGIDVVSSPGNCGRVDAELSQHGAPAAAARLHPDMHGRPVSRGAAVDGGGERAGVVGVASRVLILCPAHVLSNLASSYNHNLTFTTPPLPITDKFAWEGDWVNGVNPCSCALHQGGEFNSSTGCEFGETGG